jgi:hypothetical protein
MTADELIAEAETFSRQQYPDDQAMRLAYKCGMLQGYIRRMDAEIATLKQFQKNDEDEILTLQRQLIEKDI